MPRLERDDELAASIPLVGNITVEAIGARVHACVGQLEPFSAQLQVTTEREAGIAARFGKRSAPRCPGYESVEIAAPQQDFADERLGSAGTRQRARPLHAGATGKSSLELLDRQALAGVLDGHSKIADDVAGQIGLVDRELGSNLRLRRQELDHTCGQISDRCECVGFWSDIGDAVEIEPARCQAGSHHRAVVPARFGGSREQLRLPILLE